MDEVEEPLSYFPRRGDVYHAELDPVRGSEQGGRRPCLVIQNDIGNEHSPVTIVTAISSRHLSRAYPTDVTIGAGEGGLPIPSRAILNQIRTVDKQRLGRRLGHLSDERMAEVDQAIRVSLGLVTL